MFLKDLPSTNAIRIGSLYFKPSKGVESRLAKSVRLVITESTEYPDYKGKAGSCTLVSLGIECFVICTRHQLGIKKGGSPDKRILESTRFTSTVDGEKLSNIPTDVAIFEFDNDDEEYNDIIFFRASQDHLAQKERSSFYPLEKFDSPTRHLSWIIGYPTERNVITYEPQRVDIVGQIFDCSLDNNFKSKAKNLKRFVFDKKFSALDGFSGGAVFSLIGPLNGLKILLEGVVVRAGNGLAHVVDVEFLILAISKSTQVETD
jgi:hypothetical protein